MEHPALSTVHCRGAGRERPGERDAGPLLLCGPETLFSASDTRCSSGPHALLLSRHGAEPIQLILHGGLLELLARDAEVWEMLKLSQDASVVHVLPRASQLPRALQHLSAPAAIVDFRHAPPLSC